MGSLTYAMKCPQCGRSAFEDSYYKTDETYIICYRCGYYYSRQIKETRASELIINTQVYDQEARLRSYEILSEMMD